MNQRRMQYPKKLRGSFLDFDYTFTHKSYYQINYAHIIQILLQNSHYNPKMHNIQSTIQNQKYNWLPKTP